MLKIKSPWLLCVISVLFFSSGWLNWGHPIFLFFIFIPLFFIEYVISSSLKKNKALKIWAFSYLTFLFWNLSTTWWLINASLSGMLIANIFNSLFFSILFLSFYWSKKRLPLRGAYAFFISIWISFEKLHLNWDISWPWLTLGNGFSEYIYWIQWYEYTGVFGGSLWILVINIGLFEVLKGLKSNYQINHIFKGSLKWIFSIIIPILISLLIYINIDESQNKIKVLTIQPNIDPYEEKYLYSNIQFLEKFTEQIKEFKNKDIDYIILPETYFANGFGERLNNFEKSELNYKIKEKLVGFEEVQLISGIQFFNTYSDINRTKSSNKIRENLWADFYNSAISASINKTTEFYHKSKLVVGVETLPYSDIIMPVFGKYMIDLGGTVSNRVIQKNRSIFQHPIKNIKAAPVICYESIYGEFSTEYIRLGADFFAVISNDAWWGDTPGHKQLLSITRLRAIENRRSIARSANTGISALINEKGEFIRKIDYETEGTILSEIPLVKTKTFYTTYGDFIARICFLTLILYFLMAISGRYKS
tara:strand:- start:18244 stop:19845 length:1602 start_codon:yes stop_codon:yes gene_type:complete